jgi:hypothetical protein
LASTGIQTWADRPRRGERISRRNRAGLLESAERAFDLAALLVAAVLFPDPLCGRRRRRPTMTGANGQVVAFSGT